MKSIKRTIDLREATGKQVSAEYTESLHDVHNDYKTEIIQPKDDDMTYTMITRQK